MKLNEITERLMALDERWRTMCVVASVGSENARALLTGFGEEALEQMTQTVIPALANEVADLRHDLGEIESTLAIMAWGEDDGDE